MFVKNKKLETDTHASTVRQLQRGGKKKLPLKSPKTPSGKASHPLHHLSPALSFSVDRESLGEEAACKHAAGVFSLKQQEESVCVSV